MIDRNTAQTQPEPATECSDPVFATWQAIQARIMRDLPGQRFEPSARDWSQMLDDSDGESATVIPGP